MLPGSITPLPIWWIYGKSQVRQDYGSAWFIVKPDVPTCIISHKIKQSALMESHSFASMSQSFSQAEVTFQEII